MQLVTKKLIFNIVRFVIGFLSFLSTKKPRYTNFQKFRIPNPLQSVKMIKVGPNRVTNHVLKPQKSQNDQMTKWPNDPMTQRPKGRIYVAVIRGGSFFILILLSRRFDSTILYLLDSQIRIKKDPSRYL